MKERRNSYILTLGLAAFLFSLLASAQLRADADASRTKTFNVAPGGRLEVSTSGGDIIIDTAEKNQLTVRAEGIDDDDLDKLEMSQSGNTVHVEFHPNWGYSGDVRFVISMPMEFETDLRTAGGDIRYRGGVKGTMRASTAGGDITAESIEGAVTFRTSGGDLQLGEVKGEADISTSGGDIKVGNVTKMLKASTSGGDVGVGNVGGDADVSTSGGDVKIGKVSGSATLRTAGGDIELEGATGSVVAKTAGGDLVLHHVTGTIEGKTAGGDITAELMPAGKGGSELGSSGGTIHLAIDPNAKATIDALIHIRGTWHRSDRYEIRSDFPSAEYHRDDDEIHGKYLLNGGGDLIELSTSGGDIEIRKLAR